MKAWPSNLVLVSFAFNARTIHVLRGYYAATWHLFAVYGGEGGIHAADKIPHKHWLSLTCHPLGPTLVLCTVCSDCEG